ncbi:MAG: hypothetical protein U0841_15375 [Chloroflexia bacterium]
MRRTGTPLLGGDGEERGVALAARLTGLWRHRFPQTLGRRVGRLLRLHLTALALPLTAAVSLNATPLEMGILGAMGSAPSLVVSLFAGA